MRHAAGVIVGMSLLGRQYELREAFSLASGPDGMDAQAALRLKRRSAEEFRTQLMIGAPNDADEAGFSCAAECPVKEQQAGRKTLPLASFTRQAVFGLPTRSQSFVPMASSAAAI